MSFKITLGNASKVTNSLVRSPEVIIGDKVLKLDRSIYQNIRSLVKNKNILNDYLNGNLSSEYVELLNFLNDINQNNKFPLLEQIPISASIYILDEYLGSLGVGEEYYYSKDYVNIKEWISTTEQSEYRILVDATDNTYLIDNTDDTVLVHYT